MAIIAEKTATAQQFLTDIATTLTGLADWTDADAEIVNDNSTNDWYNNARVLQHTPSGLYFLFVNAHMAYGYPIKNGYDDRSGIRVIVSTDWQTDESQVYDNGNFTAPSCPWGKTTVNYSDNWGDIQDACDQHNYDGSPVMNRSDSFKSIDIQGNENDDGSLGAWFQKGYHNNDTDVSYFLSAGNSHLVIGCWLPDETNSDRQASYLGIEMPQNKFFDDGATYDLAIYSQTSHGHNNNVQQDYVYPTSMYGFSSFTHENNEEDDNLPGEIGGRKGCVGQGRWGQVNPDPTDDTFLYQRAPIYTSSAQNTPVGVIESALPNHYRHGLSHGDTVTVDGITYRAIEKAESQEQTVAKALLRYE